MVARDAGSQETELFAETLTDRSRGTLCLVDGQYGVVAQNGQVSSRNSLLGYLSSYGVCSFAVAIQGRDLGIVVDLGASAPLLRRCKGDSPFAAMCWKDDAVRIGTEAVATPPKPTSGNQSVPVSVGHFYVARIQGSIPTSPGEIVALIEVIEHEPGKRVKFRWKHL